MIDILRYTLIQCQKWKKILIGTRLDVYTNSLWTKVVLLLGDAKVNSLKFLMAKTRKFQICAHVLINMTKRLSHVENCCISTLMMSQDSVGPVRLSLPARYLDI